MRLKARIDVTLLLLLGAGLAARLLVAVPAFRNITRSGACYDALSYHLLASHMLGGQGYSVSLSAPYKPNSTITPGYPGFLTAVYALTGNSKLAVILVQIVLNLLVLGMLYRFVKKRYGEKPAMWTGLIFVADLNTAMFCAQRTTETLFTLLLVSFLLVFLKSQERRHYALSLGSGLLLGAATLVRPISLYFGVPLLLLMLFTRISWRKLGQWGIILGIQLICIAPWVARNKAVFGEYFYTTISDVNLMRFHAAPLKAGVEKKPRMQAQKELEVKGLAGRDEKDLNEGQIYRIYGRAARGYLFRHPFAYAGSLVMGGVTSLIYPLPMAETGFYFRGPANLPQPGVAQSVLIRVMKGEIIPAIKVAWQERLVYFGLGVFILFLIYGVFHLAKLGLGVRAYIVKGLRDPCMLLFLLTGMYLMGLLGFGISARMRVPAEPLLAVLAGIGIASRRKKRNETNRGGNP